MSRPEERRKELERLLERARRELPRWADSPSHDPGTTLLELLSFLGDTLAEYADAVAGEAYLGTGHPRVRLEIAGRAWQSVTSLADSGPDDLHYVVSEREDGATVVEFGDGVHGRRPPAGSGLRVAYRRGARWMSVEMQEGRVILDDDSPAVEKRTS
ncbi:MAG TPA: hypothetical protein VMP67_05495 [Candidatus Limnocylindria bacterium]|nr:hypothetical protein [Candidatus Limnocylindria bacterium]